MRGRPVSAVRSERQKLMTPMQFELDHVILDLTVEDPRWLERFEPMRELLHEIVGTERLKVIGERFHQFQPSGYTGYLLLAQSHVSVHSWVEDRMVTLDVLCCVSGASRRVADTLIGRLQPAKERRVVIRRGEDNCAVE